MTENLFCFENVRLGERHLWEGYPIYVRVGVVITKWVVEYVMALRKFMGPWSVSFGGTPSTYNILMVCHLTVIWGEFGVHMCVGWLTQPPRRWLRCHRLSATLWYALVRYDWFIRHAVSLGYRSAMVSVSCYILYWVCLKSPTLLLVGKWKPETLWAMGELPHSQSNFRGIPNTLKILMGFYPELSQILGVYPTLLMGLPGLSQICDGYTQHLEKFWWVS